MNLPSPRRKRRLKCPRRWRGRCILNTTSPCLSTTTTGGCRRSATSCRWYVRLSLPPYRPPRPPYRPPRPPY
eukprot:540611-Prorocentrum_minimum.AAC.1